MLIRPRDLIDRVSDRQQLETLTLPLAAARSKAREILDQTPQSGFTAVIEKMAATPGRSD